MKQKRPNRKIEAEKRRIAREILMEFGKTDEFRNLSRKVQLAIMQMIPKMKESIENDETPELF